MRTPASRILAIASLALAVVMTPASAVAFQQSCQTPSLGTIARKLKKERAREKQKSVPVFTNDDLRALTPPPTASQEATEQEKSKEPSPSASASSPAAAQKDEEKYFRSKAEAIRLRLELHQRQLAALEQQWGLASTEYYPNPQKTLEEESTPKFHSNTNKLRAKIEETKRQIADARKAMDDLREELRR